ncbi:hypothetical protein C1646_665984 [Rhizophagus diaphanus]|nr:hypothetical protein C1646_665984 [Rhizophagus diaphanus] [Rhizophagus sp. MUCL 43196]
MSVCEARKCPSVLEGQRGQIRPRIRCHGPKLNISHHAVTQCSLTRLREGRVNSYYTRDLIIRVIKPLARYSNFRYKQKTRKNILLRCERHSQFIKQNADNILKVVVEACIDDPIIVIGWTDSFYN